MAARGVAEQRVGADAERDGRRGHARASRRARRRAPGGRAARFAVVDPRHGPAAVVRVQLGDRRAARRRSARTPTPARPARVATAALTTPPCVMAMAVPSSDGLRVEPAADPAQQRGQRLAAVRRGVRVGHPGTPRVGVDSRRKRRSGPAAEVALRERGSPTASTAPKAVSRRAAAGRHQAPRRRGSRSGNRAAASRPRGIQRLVGPEGRGANRVRRRVTDEQQPPHQAERGWAIVQRETSSG